MANEAKLVGIKNSWSFMAFARMMGKPKYAKDMTNRETGEKFTSIAFMNPDDPTQVRCFANFSSNLGVLSKEELAAQKDNLQVVELESGTYKICKQGENNWEDIDLGL